jgi:DNA-binding transcriptional MerR regulator
MISAPMKKQTTKNDAIITIPELAVRELNQVEQMLPDFSMQDLVNWVNQAVARFYPEADESGDKRVSNSFTVRTLRHYQTLGCIDAPEKVGRCAIYGFRHYLQALMIRKLLYLRCSPDSIRATLKGKTNTEYKQMLFADLDIVSSASPVAVLHHPVDTPAKETSQTTQHESWLRIPLGPGAELHLEGPPVKLTAARKKELLQQIKNYLKG